MRDPDRIMRIVGLLGQAWALVPDWRLGQLVSNLLGMGPPQDVFYVEDDEWESRLEKLVAKVNLSPSKIEKPTDTTHKSTTSQEGD